MLNVNDDIRNILYQSDVNTIAAMQANTSTAISNWGAGLKIFTYYTQGSIGWVMQSPDMTNIRYLLNYKADLNSPAFTGSPTAPTPLTGDSSTKLATTAFVSSTVENISSTSERNIAENFNNSLNYEVGDYVYYNDKLYRFVLSHSAGEWSNTQVEPVSITDDLQSTKQILNSILVDNGITTILSNDEKAKLSSFSSTAGFTRITNNSNLVEFNYPYSRNVTTPTVSLPLSLGTGKWLVGFKFRLVPDSVVTSTSNYRINWVQGSVSYNGIGGWTTASKYLTTLNSITLQLSQNPNINYNPTGNNTITLSIKDLYIYNLDNLDENIADNIDFRNYIISEQNRNYQNGTVIYSLPDIGTDKTLTQEGKVADAKVVGDIFKDILVEKEGEYVPDDSLSISGKAADAAAVRDAINDFTVDQESYTLTNLTPLENFEPAPVFVTEDEDGYTKIYHIQDSNYGTQNYDDPNDPHYVDRFNYVPRAYSKYQYIICNIDINFDPTKTYLINFQYAFLYGLCDSLVLYCSANFGASEYVIFDKEQDSLPLSSGEFKRYFKILDPPRYDNMAIKLKYSNSELNGQLFDETFYIKNLYLYDITSIKSNKNLINYIKEKQSNYDINPIDEIFTYTLPKTDFSLSLLGKAADAKAVGNAINAIAPPDWNQITRLVNESGPYINTMTISDSGWYSLEVGKSNSSTSVSGTISLYDTRQEIVTYDLAAVSDHSSDNLVLFTPWLYFTAGTAIHINGYAHHVGFYYAPCMQLGL